MSIKFNIQETVESELFYGSYVIYILGGHHIEVNSNFYVQILNLDTNEDIQLTEFNLKGRDFKIGKKAIKFYTFDINEYGKFKISVHNYKDVIMQDSILELFPFPFNIPHKIISKLLGRSRENKSLDEIDIFIG